MNAYKPRTPRAAFALTAVTMAASTFGALVVLPAQLESVDAGGYTQAAAKIAPIAHTDR